MAKIASLVFLAIWLTASKAIALQYMDPRDKDINFKGLLNDSIPLMMGERVVLERKGLVARWVVAIVNQSYEEVRQQIADSVSADFGIAQEKSITVDDFNNVDPNMPTNPLFGEGFSGFRQLVTNMKLAREHEIISKDFNHSAKVDGQSVSRWRIGDGTDIFGRPSSIIVVERADYSREWARDHMGLPWPFKMSGTNWLVTETEINTIERLKTKSKALKVQYFIPYPAYKTGAVLELMNAMIREAENNHQRK